MTPLAAHSRFPRDPGAASAAAIAASALTSIKDALEGELKIELAPVWRSSRGVAERYRLSQRFYSILSMQSQRRTVTLAFAYIETDSAVSFGALE